MMEYFNKKLVAFAIISTDILLLRRKLLSRRCRFLKLIQ